MSGIRAERYDAISYRLIDETGVIVGLALLLANGRWGPFDKDGNPIIRIQLASPSAVADWWAEYERVMAEPDAAQPRKEGTE